MTMTGAKLPFLIYGKWQIHIYTTGTVWRAVVCQVCNLQVHRSQEVPDTVPVSGMPIGMHEWWLNSSKSLGWSDIHSKQNIIFLSCYVVRLEVSNRSLILSCLSLCCPARSKDFSLLLRCSRFRATQWQRYGRVVHSLLIDLLGKSQSSGQVNGRRDTRQVTSCLVCETLEELLISSISSISITKSIQ